MKEEDEDEDEKDERLLLEKKKNRSKIEKSEKKDNVRQKMINLHLLKRLVIVSFLFSFSYFSAIKIETKYNCITQLQTHTHTLKC